MTWKKVGKALLFPHPAVLALICVTAVTLLIYSFVALATTDVLSIAAYTLSFYALTALCLRIPDIIRFVQRFRRENKYYLLYKSDVQLRMNITLYGAFGFNAFYALFQLWLGLVHHSAWFYAMAGYYLLLACLRLMLARTIHTHPPGENLPLEWRKYRLCGAWLTTMTLVLFVFTMYFVFQTRTFVHHEITTIAMAAYTFTALTLAIINLIRYQKYHSPAISAAREVSLAAAAVSMLTLENALFTAFGQETSILFRQIMLGATGIAVVLLVTAMAILMVIRASKALKH